MLQTSPTASNTLLSTPAMTPAESDGCVSLLTDIDPADAHVIAVTYRKSAAQWRSYWTQHVGMDPAEMVIIDMNDSGPAVTSASAGIDDHPDRDVTEVIQSPHDLTGLGITISEYLKEWYEQNAPIVVCFDSLTALLQYVDTETVFKFLHIFTGRIQTADAIAHYHIDPEAHDDQTVHTLAQLFDAIVDADANGELRIRN